MRIPHLLLSLCLALSPCSVRAQSFFRNLEGYMLFGASSVPAQTIGGSSLAAPGAVAGALEIGYAYPILRRPHANLSVEAISVFGGADESIAAGALDRGWFAPALPGLRVEVPLRSRLAVYGAAGGGVGSFDMPYVGPGAIPSLQSTSTWHGIFEFGGGVDVSLFGPVSLRVEMRDYVTGAGLSGVAGRNHPIPAGGLIFRARNPK